MSEFKREERYLVLKKSRLTEDDIDQIRHSLNRYGWDRALTECVVVEPDWAIYEQVWDMVQRMAEGRPQQSDSIALLYLLSKIRQACGDNGLRMQNELVDHIADISKKAAERDQLLEALTNIKNCPEPDLAEYCKSVDDIACEALAGGEAITNAKQRDQQN